MIPREILKKIRQIELRTLRGVATATSVVASALLLCSCVTRQQPSALVVATELPREADINRDAGRGGMLNVNLRTDDGDTFEFLLDTGASATTLDKSMLPKLGKRLSRGKAGGWDGSSKVELYAAPKLYFGETRLVTADKIWVGGSRILGMDCLKHYCVQFDFAAGKMRFLDSNQLDPAELGKAYPLTYWKDIPFIHHPGLLGKSGTNLLVDMGCRTDGMEAKAAINGIAQVLPECIWDGANYTNLSVAAVGKANVLGLGFLARHLVTFDFPKHTMYLKQTSIGSIADGDLMGANRDARQTPADCFQRWKEKSQLPGVSKDEPGIICVEAYSNFDARPANESDVAYVRAFFRPGHKSVTFNFCKNGDPSAYHYIVSRDSLDNPWKLQRAWQTDQTGQIIREFPRL